MAQSVSAKLAGILSTQAALASAFSTSFNAVMPLDVCATYGADASGIVHATGTSGTPFPIPFQSITKGRLFALRLLSGATVELRITTGLGVAAIKVSNVFFVHAPNPGDEITAIGLVTVPAGVDVQYLLLGDV